MFDRHLNVYIPREKKRSDRYAMQYDVAIRER